MSPRQLSEAQRRRRIREVVLLRRLQLGRLVSEPLSRSQSVNNASGTDADGPA